MFNKTRKIFAALLSLIIAFSIATAPAYAIDDSTFAVAESTVEPRWQNTMATTVALSFKNSKAIISVDVVGYVGTTFSKGTVMLTKLTGSNTGTIKKWTGLSCSSNIFTFDNESTPVTSSGLYRVNFSITVTRNGVSEVVTGYKDAIY